MRDLDRISCQRPLVIDSFAGGGGASTGLAWALGRDPDIAINHNASALAMHAANHPDSLHLREDVFSVDIQNICAGRPVDVAWFSPDCKHHSKAKGGRPVDRKIRGLAWIVVKWAKQIRPRVIFLENVVEFEHWGPLDDDGRPCKVRRGFTFKRWVRELRRLGYDVEWRHLVASDYGVPTTRKRLFMVARCDGQPIQWPERTHGPDLKRPIGAAECIDWNLPVRSIFGRTKPLVPNTLLRIGKGLRRYVIDRGEPFVVRTGHFSNRTGAGATFRGQATTRPLSTITSKNDYALVMPWIAAKGCCPLPRRTAAARTDSWLPAAFLTKWYGTRAVGADLRSPMPTQTTKDRFGLVKALLAEHGGGAEPVVGVHGRSFRIVDVGLRMFVPRELAAAHGFPSDYVLTGTKTDQVNKIGNSVPPRMAQVLVQANVSHQASRDAPQLAN